MPSAARLVLAAALAALLPAGVLAQVLYKWTDAEGKIQYSDKRPKDFKGPVTLIESDPAPVAEAPPRPATPPAAPPKAKEAVKAEPDLVTRRRAVRAELYARLTLARDRLEAARKALSEATGPEPEERQVIQQQMKAGAGGMHGLSAQRSNCREVVKDGRKVVMCPAMLANDAYFERMGRLEVAVRQAEEDLAEAEQAYRRGVD